MATLLIGAAVNIGVGILLNTLFPPPDIEQEGPRLTDLGFTSAAYGTPINITFGTDRIDGNIIDTPEPAIEERVSLESQSAGGKGGGQKVNTTTYSYFLTARIGWGIEGADAMIRMWADGKIIFDASGTEQITKAGFNILFYPGGVTQVQDPEEVSRRDTDIPAYRHLTSTKMNAVPLADFGNRIPNFTAEIAYNSTVSTPVLALTEPTGIDVPGSLSGADTSYMMFNAERNELYSLKSEANGLWTADGSTLAFRAFHDGTGGVNLNSHPTVGKDNFAYRQIGTTNAGPLEKIDIETDEVVGTLGNAGLGLTDDSDSFGNSGQWYQLSVNIPGIGVQSVLFHLTTAFPAGGPPNGSVVDADAIENPLFGFNPIVHTISTDDGLVDDSGPLTGFGIPDHDRNRFFIFQDDDLNGEYRLVEYIPKYATGISGHRLNRVETRIVKQFTRGTFAAGDDFEGTGDPTGWAVNRSNGDLILSNGTSTVLYNPDTNTILAQKANASFNGRNNYYAGDIIAYGITSATNGTIRVLDTRTLEIIRDIKTDDIPWPDATSDGVIHGESCVWDDRVQALFLSRVDVSSTATTDNRVLKVFVNRVSAAGVGLDFVVNAISTKYQRLTMAGLVDADVDVTTLAGDIVSGYTLNNGPTMRGALQPLRDRYLFDAVQSDWIMKFPKRGATPAVTVPEEDVGMLRRGRDLTDTPPLREIRADDLSIPMALAIRYKNKETDYQIDYERDKRHLFPNPTMHSKTEQTLNIPMVDIPDNMKKTVQKHLLTAWNERVSYKTVIPWTYIALDATDVFNMGVFGETVQLRMAENDLGAGWAIELTGVVEDTKSFSSTISGATGAGHVSQTIPSTLPTRLFMLDGPTLSLEDIQITPVSMAYMVVSSFEDGWPGATVMKSLTDVDYVPTGTVNTEAAIGRVNVAPGAWPYVEGDFRNRFQEIVEGGTMTITPLRRESVWATAASEETVLNGANIIAVIHSDDTVEILQFQTVTVNDDNTVVLDRLLRGRLGTEDIVEAGLIAQGDTVILLTGATGLKEDAAIIKQRFLQADLNIVTFFKGVTIGVLIEDVTPISGTYTGRDLRPFSVVHTTAVNNAGDIDVDWERRVRGPFAGEWLDGSGEVVLNENIERYEMIITDGVDSLTKIIDDATTGTFTAAELSSASISGAVTVTVTQVSETALKSPITPASTATATV